MLEPEEMKRWQRLTAAMLKHAAEDDPEALAQVVGVINDAMAGLADVVDSLRAPRTVNGVEYPGYSWAEIGAALNVTRQAAYQRFSQ